MKKTLIALAALALGLAVLAPAGVASATNPITSGVGEVNLGPIVMPDAATHWTVTWSYKGSGYVSSNLGAPSVQIQAMDNPNPANGDYVGPDEEPSGINGSGKILYCSNACNTNQGQNESNGKYWLIVSVCTAPWTVKVSYTTHSATVVLPALHLAERGGPNGLSDCDGHLT